MLRSSIFRSRLLLALTVTAFVLLLVPLNTLANPGSSTGAIVGFIYGSDMKTPVEKAVVKIRNIKDGQEFFSAPTDAVGAYKIERLEEGSYVLGISAPDGDYNFNYSVRVKGGEIGKLSLALKAGEVSALGQGSSGGSEPKPSFFYTPVGIAVLMVATTVVLYGAFKLIEEEEEASPSKKINAPGFQKQYLNSEKRGRDTLSPLFASLST